MIVFAWILWSWLLIVLGIHATILIVAFKQYKKNKTVTVNIDIFEVFFNMACFIFLSFYLFN